MRSPFTMVTGRSAALSATACVLATTCTLPPGPEASDLRVVVHLSNHAHFEGEPIYFAARLRNDATDTAWVQPFQLETPYLRGWLERSDGTLVPYGSVMAHPVPSAGWRGIPIAPGQSAFETGVLQSYWGASQPNDLYVLGGLAPGAYRLHFRFSWSPAEPGAFLYSTPIPITVVPRTTPQDSTYHEVLRISGMVWDSTQRDQYLPALFSYLDGHVASKPPDPFVVLLLTHKISTAAVFGLQLDSVDQLRLDALALTILDRQRDAAAGGHLVAFRFANRSSHLLAIADLFPGSLVGDVAASLQSGMPALLK